MPKEINPQVKYGHTWRDSVDAITNMGLNIGSLQSKEKATQGDTRRAFTRMIAVAKKTRDEAIEKHKKKFPIKVNETLSDNVAMAKLSKTKIFKRLLPAILRTKDNKVIVGKRGDWHNEIAGKHNLGDGTVNDPTAAYGYRYKDYARGFYDPLKKKFHNADNPKKIISSLDAAYLSPRSGWNREQTIHEGRMKEWLMAMQDHVHELSAKHGRDKTKAKAEFLKKYPGQDRVFHDTFRTTSGTYPIPGWKPARLRKETSRLKKIGQQLVTEATDQKSKITMADKVLDRLALFGFFPTKEWPTPEERAQMDASS